MTMLYDMRRYFARIDVSAGKKSRMRRWVRQRFRIYFTEAEIMKDMLQWLWSDRVAVERLVASRGLMYMHSNTLMGRWLRNTYGFWEEANPLTEIRDSHLEKVDGIISDPRHPDNLSGKLVEEIFRSIKETVEVQRALTAEAVERELK